MNYKINLVEDDMSLNEILKLYLEKEGYEVSTYSSFDTARDAALNEAPPHLWVLDIMLGDGGTGYDLFNLIKDKNESQPILFMSARDSDVDRILGLEMGADDYISKPFLPKELIIRVNKQIAFFYENVAEAIDTLRLEPYSIELLKRKVTDEDGKQIELTTKELDLLIFLGKHKGRAFSRDEILRAVWGEDYFGTDRAVDDLVKRVRKKLSRLDIETIYGYGYRIV